MTTDNLNLSEAAALYLATLIPEDRETSQPEVNRFVRWFGADRPIARLTPPEVANYAERLSLTDIDYARRLEQVRAFLICAKKKGWTSASLSIHLKAKKVKPGPAKSGRSALGVIHLTKEGLEEMKAELAALRDKRPSLIEEIRKAAADKDFRENAPLHAAREKLGHLEGRIIDLEETLKIAHVIDKSPKSRLKAGIGDSVVLWEMASGEEKKYRIVSPNEVDPFQGKISSVSPIGKALLGRAEGDTVEISIPAGKVRYQVQRIEH